jgi:long-chain acyl-CoA synthetase
VTILDDIRARAANRPDHSAIAVAHTADGAVEESVSYGALVAAMERCSALVRGAVDGPARRVGLVAPQGATFVTTALGILDAGCCLVPIPDDQSESAMREFAQRSQVHALVRADRDATIDATIDAISGAPAPTDDFAALNPAYLRFTSGTTSARKGVVISHGRILERLTAANRGMAITADDRVLWLLPMAHHFVVSILLYLRNGATILLPGNSLARSVLGISAHSQPTVFYASPYHYALLAKDTSGQRLDSLRLAVSTAEGLRDETAVRFSERYGCDLVQALGVIEVGLPVMNLASAGRKPTALGRALPDYVVWLRGDDGRRVPAGGSPENCGEVCIRGPGMFDAYLDPWTPSAAVLEPDGFRTGDQGRFDADGDLHLVGRRANRINMAGMKFFCEEVEAVLDRHPAIERSRVSAREHPHLGQTPVAEIVLRPGSDEPAARTLADFCREHLPAYKIPRQFSVVAALPMTATGKVRRR